MRFPPAKRIARRVVYSFVLVATALIVYKSAASLEARGGIGPRGIRSWEIFDRGKFKLASSSNDSLAKGETDKDKKALALDIKRRSSRAVVNGDESLEPIAGHTFVVSFAFRFDKLPESGERSQLVSKISPQHPFTGWAVGMRVFRDSVRPDIYLRDTYGKGGWHLFDNINIEAGKWYSFSAIVRASEYVALYIEPLNFTGNAVSPFSSVPDGEVTFVGGYELSSLGDIHSQSDLILGWKGIKKKSFKGQIGSVLLGFADEFPQKRDGVKSYLQGGPDSISTRLSAEDVKFYLAARGKDESRFSRQLKLLGQASWQMPEG